MGCTGCPAGTASANVGADADGDCTGCLAGSYAQGGNSDCLKCPAGTSQVDPGMGSCNVCPTNSWAQFPGMVNCLRCANGVASIATTDGGTSSAGYQVLDIPGTNDLKGAGCTVAADYKPLLTTTCAMTTVTKLSVKVEAVSWPAGCPHQALHAACTRSCRVLV